MCIQHDGQQSEQILYLLTVILRYKFCSSSLSFYATNSVAPHCHFTLQIL